MDKKSPRRLSLEDLIALNDEIRGLARAGVPLDRGLRAVATDLSGRLSKSANTLGEQLELGHSLEESLDHLGEIPPAYRAVITAGLKSGRLPAALEGIATSSRQAAEMARVTAVAMIYPTIVLAVASGLFAFTITNTLPVVLETYHDFGFELTPVLKVQIQLSEWILKLLPWVWLAVIFLFVVWWIRSRSSTAIYTGGLGWLPTMSRLIREGRLATFTEVLALLIEQQLPLTEAIALAADSTGDPRLRAAGKTFTDRLRSGEVRTIPAGIPPLMGWLLLSGSRPE